MINQKSECNIKGFIEKTGIGFTIRGTTDMVSTKKTRASTIFSDLKF